MIRRVIHHHQIITYRSDALHRLGIPHAFTTRHLTESQRALLPETLGCGLGGGVQDPITVRQVHGSRCIDVSADLRDDESADAMTTSSPKVTLAIRTADCVPILLADRRLCAVAGVHAGWRGMVSGVIASAVRTMSEQHGVEPTELVAAVGPAIGVNHYEVGPEVAQAFHEADLTIAINNDQGPKPHVDLQTGTIACLTRAGVPDASIDRANLCTYRDADDFFSFRREGERAGRQEAWIATARR